jgi:hypothetical protein
MNEDLEDVVEKECSQNQPCGDGERAAATSAELSAAVRELFAENMVRVEALIYLPGTITGDDCFPESFEDFCEYLPEHPDAALYAQIPAMARFADDDADRDHEVVAEVLYGLPGFLVQAATPSKTWGASGGCYYSWGHYYSAWLYASTEGEIAAVCVAWAKGRDEADRAKALGQSLSPKVTP